MAPTDGKIIGAAPENGVPLLLEQALSHFSRLEMEEGCRLLDQALAKEPSNHTVLAQLFKVLRNDPANPRFLRHAEVFLGLLVRHSSTHDEALQVHGDFLKAAGRLALSAELSARLSTVYVDRGELQPAEHLLAAAIRRQPELPAIPSALLKLARGYQKAGNTARYVYCLKLLLKRFPGANEGKVAKRVVLALPAASPSS